MKAALASETANPNLDRRAFLGRLAKAAALSSIGAWGCAKTKPAEVGRFKDYNLVVIVIDALRADHLGCYGCARDTSPFLDTLARQGLVFACARANSTYTRESVSALLTGRLPGSSGSAGWNTRPNESLADLGRLFREAGYQTDFVSNQPALRIPAFTDALGFENVQHLQKEWVSRGGPKLSEAALAFAKVHARDKFMMYVHYLDPHANYAPPKETYVRFTNEEFPNPVSFPQVRDNCVELVKQGFKPGDPRFEDFMLRYDAEIAHTDLSVETLMKGLEELGVLDKTLVVVTADHGEEFLDHGYVDHAWTLYEEVLRVPLVFWAPGAIRPRRDPSPVSLVDLMPTLLTALEIPHERRDFDGVSLFRPVRGGFSFQPPDGPVFAQLLIQERCVLQAVIQNDLKYVAVNKWLNPGERPRAIKRRSELTAAIRNGQLKRAEFWDQPVREQIYDLVEDPHEQRNLLMRNVRKQDEFRALLREFGHYCRTVQPGAGEPPPATPVSPQEQEELNSIGYL